MAGKAGLKAGLIGAVVMAVVTVITSLLPLAVSTVGSLVSCGISLVLYVGIGALAGFFLTAPRTPGKGAGAGAIAGLISWFLASVVSVAMMAAGLSAALDSPQVQQAIEQGGYNPMTLVLIGLPCSLALGVGVAAIGGAIYAAIQPD
jgi:hypothetical protein